MDMGATHSLRMYSFSAEVSCSSSFDVTLRSAASTMPSFARMPMAVPAWEMASSAYSTWYRRPSGEKMVVWAEHCQTESSERPPRGWRHRPGWELTRESYLRAISAVWFEAGGCRFVWCACVR